MGYGDMGSDTFDDEGARVYGRLFAAARAQ